MASVLVTRAVVANEMYNDLDGRVVNWWEMLRLHTNRFCQDVETMPAARTEFERAHHMLVDPSASDYDRAIAVQVILHQASLPSLGKYSWGRTKHKDRRVVVWRSERVRVLAERIRYVQLECRPAIDVLDWVQSSEHAVIYCDPPYFSSDVSSYKHSGMNVDGLTEALQAQAGRVAISGYGYEWDQLGWQRHEKDVSFGAFGRQVAQGAQRRTEVLWTNYDALTEGAAYAQ